MLGLYIYLVLNIRVFLLFVCEFGFFLNVDIVLGRLGFFLIGDIGCYSDGICVGFISLGLLYLFVGVMEGMFF